jgi:hypothetical protein
MLQSRIGHNEMLSTTQGRLWLREGHAPPLRIGASVTVPQWTIYDTVRKVLEEHPDHLEVADYVVLA